MFRFLLLLTLSFVLLLACKEEENCDKNGNSICDDQEVLGCMDPISANYNELANIDDGSCIYCDLIDQELYSLSEPLYASKYPGGAVGRFLFRGKKSDYGECKPAHCEATLVIQNFTPETMGFDYIAEYYLNGELLWTQQRSATVEPNGILDHGSIPISCEELEEGTIAVYYSPISFF